MVTGTRRTSAFIDWVDRDGKAHDHIHLLANTVPVTFGYATPAQAAAVRRLVEEMPSSSSASRAFVAADIAGYTKSEIGNGGPYDLSAAGRYWYWDAAFRESQKQNSVLLDQLKAVAAEGAKDNYFMASATTWTTSTTSTARMRMERASTTSIPTSTRPC